MRTDEACPLCSCPFSGSQEIFEVDPIVREWKRCFGLDITGEFQGISRFTLQECGACKLRFFLPSSLAGSPRIYEGLEKFDWYYMPHRWEHDMALEDLEKCTNGLEVGCGFGDFVALVCNEKRIAFEGCEQNPSAVEKARSKGITVRLDTLQSLAKSRPSAYSAVCAFQVLEHVPDPGSFLNATCTLLHPGGKLMLGLPNAHSYLRYQVKPLDRPPHHMSRWTREVLARIPSFFPLQLVRTANEPIANYHLAEFVDAYTDILARYHLRIFAHPGIRSRITRFIRWSRIQKVLTGHTIYACYVRT